MTTPEIDAAAREAIRPFAMDLAEAVFRETGRDVSALVGPAIANAGRAVLTAVEPLIRAEERERIAKLADEVGATVPTCPCQPEKGIGDPEHVGGAPEPFANLIRETTT